MIKVCKLIIRAGGIVLALLAIAFGLMESPVYAAISLFGFGVTLYY